MQVFQFSNIFDGLGPGLGRGQGFIRPGPGQNHQKQCVFQYFSSKLLENLQFSNIFQYFPIFSNFYSGFPIFQCFWRFSTQPALLTRPRPSPRPPKILENWKTLIKIGKYWKILEKIGKLKVFQCFWWKKLKKHKVFNGFGLGLARPSPGPRRMAVGALWVWPWGPGSG